MGKVEWFYSPKFQVGFWVNFIFVFYTMVAPVPPERRGLYMPSLHGNRPAERTTSYAPPPQPAPSSGATAVDLGNGRTLLTNDLTLVNKSGRTLVLSPSLIMSQFDAAPPATVTLRFIIFNDDGEACPGACMFFVNADGTRVFESPAAGTFSTGWTHEKFPSSTTNLPDGQVARTLTTETFTTQIPYKTFLAIVAADRVVLSLGPDRVELTREQKAALRGMLRRVEPPPPPAAPPKPAAGPQPKIINAY